MKCNETNKTKAVLALLFDMENSSRANCSYQIQLKLLKTKYGDIISLLGLH